MASLLHAQPADELGLDRQLGGGQREGFPRRLFRDAVDLEHDAAGMDAGDPELGRALAASHAHFGRLGRDRHVRKDPDPDAAEPLQVTRDRTPRGLDLARGHPLRLHGLEAEGAEIEIGPAFGGAVDAALMGLSEFRSLGRKHDLWSSAPGAGLLFLGALVLGHRVMRQDLALEHPHLHAAGAVSRLGRSDAEIDVGTQRVQRHAAFAIPLDPGDFRPAEPAGTIDSDTLGAKPHGRLDRALHGTAKGNPALELLGDILGHQLGIDFRLADFEDVEGDLAPRHLRKVLAQLLDVGALLADDHARPRRVDGDAGALGRPLDDDATDAGLAQALHQVLTELQVLMQQLGVVVVGIPARVPGPVHADAQADRIGFLAHYAFSSRSRTTMVRLLHIFCTLAPRPRARAWKRFRSKARPTLASAT